MCLWAIWVVFLIAPRIVEGDQIPELPFDADVTESEITEIKGSHVIEKSSVKNDGGKLETKVTTINTSNGDRNHTFELTVHCGMKYIVLYVNTQSNFTGVIYPKNANPSCMGRYSNASSTFTFRFPLRGCNTRHRLTENAIEYYNTLVFQPHAFLVTPDVKNFNLMCQYTTHTQTLTTNFAVNYNESGKTTNLFQLADPPRLFMEIYTGRLSSRITAEEVIVGENITMVVGMENYEMYSLRVTNCHVNSGMGDQHLLYDKSGCTIDGFVMGPLIYSEDLRFSFVTFAAHKFPFSENVYYRCEIKFCVRKLNNCGPMPPKCDPGNPQGLQSEILPNEEFFRIFGAQNFTHRSNYEDYSRFIRPQLNDTNFLSREGPLLGGLTPEMIQKFFAEDEKRTSDMVKNMRRGRSLRSPDSTDEDPVNYPLGLLPKDIYEVEFGLKVTEDGQANNNKRVPILEELPGASGYPVPPTVCWSQVRRPMIITSIFLIPAFVFAVVLGLQVHKCFATPREAARVETGTDSREYPSTPNVYYTPDPEGVEIEGTYDDYRRRFRRFHSQPNIMEAVDASYSRPVRGRSHLRASSIDLFCEPEANAAHTSRNICVVGTPVYNECFL